MSALNHKIVVIGGGAAGMMAAGWAAEAGGHVELLEPNQRLGMKLAITGKGRCNVTNQCGVDEVLKNIPRNGRFLYSALDAFPPEAAMAFFEAHGCPLKVERGNRVFPVSDRSSSVIQALTRFLEEHRVLVRRARATEIVVENGAVCGVRTEQGFLTANRVILATGGCSYPRTGSTGDGYRLAQALGHTIQSPRGSLVPLEEDGETCPKLQGLSLRNCAIRVKNAAGKTIYTDFGELLFTHFGLSGPVIRSASAHGKPGEIREVLIDLKPALDEQKLDQRILRDLEQYQNRNMDHALQDLYPRLLIPVMLELADISPETKANSVTRAQRRRLLEMTKAFPVKIRGTRPVEEAIITAGGVSVREVNPKTMESKLVKGLYIAGELLDVDAYTGGFNLQIAWATGRAAGLAAAAREEEALA